MTTALKTPPAAVAVEKLGPLALGRRVTADWTGEAHAGTGMSWDEFCRARHAWLRAMGPQLQIPVRRTLVKSMRLARMSEAAIASALGVSAATVHRDRVEINDPDEPSEVWGVDGARRAGQTGRAGTPTRQVARPTVEVETEIRSQEATGLGNRDYVVYLVAEHMPRGLTAREFDELVDWHRSNLSGTLSHVERQHRLRRDGLRNGMGVYVLGDDPRVPQLEGDEQ
jgi:hypothetical protein